MLGHDGNQADEIRRESKAETRRFLGYQVLSLLANRFLHIPSSAPPLSASVPPPTCFSPG